MDPGSPPPAMGAAAVSFDGAPVCLHDAVSQRTAASLALEKTGLQTLDLLRVRLVANFLRIDGQNGGGG